MGAPIGTSDARAAGCAGARKASGDDGAGAGRGAGGGAACAAGPVVTVGAGAGGGGATLDGAASGVAVGGT
jgi:hypothetical protein